MIPRLTCTCDRVRRYEGSGVRSYAFMRNMVEELDENRGVKSEVSVIGFSTAEEVVGLKIQVNLEELCSTEDLKY